MSKPSDRNDPKPLKPLRPLKQLMKAIDCSSYQQLSQRSGVSMKQLRKIRKGQVKTIQLGKLQALSQTFKISLQELLAAIAAEAITTPLGQADPPSHPLGTYHPPESPTAALSTLTALQAEYQRLQQHQTQVAQQARLDCQTEALQVLESWLQYWPVAALAAQENPHFSATQLLPLCRPIETLLKQWHVEAIATVGQEVPYDPQVHQLIEGAVEAGAIVRVRYPGYFHQDKLHFRAKVSPVGLP